MRQELAMVIVVLMGSCSLLMSIYILYSTYSTISSESLTVTMSEQETTMAPTFQPTLQKYLERTLESLFTVPDIDSYDVYVSQDGNHSGVYNTIRSSAYPIHHLQSEYNKEQWLSRDHGYQDMGSKNIYDVYFKISSHYHRMLTAMFSSPTVNNVIILEDDMLFSPDILEFFRAMSNVVKVDPSVLCVSAWNDNGRKKLIGESMGSATRVYRTDIFPGLGWMITRTLWKELSVKWHSGFWDDWIRNEKQTQGRSCLYPEFNRVYTFGEKGSSSGQFFSKYLSDISLSKDPVDWVGFDESSLQLDAYSTWFKTMVTSSKLVTTKELFSTTAPCCNVKLVYQDEKSFKVIAKKFNLMDDFKEGKPRTSYSGVVHFTWDKRYDVWVVPESI